MTILPSTMGQETFMKSQMTLSSHAPMLFCVSSFLSPNPELDTIFVNHTGL
jgi:hypothetical protein